MRTLCERVLWRNRNLEFYSLMSMDLRCCFGLTEGVQEGRLGASCFDLINIIFFHSVGMAAMRP